MKVIMLVLNGARKKPFGLEFQHSSVEGLSSHPDTARAGHVRPRAWKTQTAFDAGLRPSKSLDFRIDQNQRHVALDLRRLARDAKQAWPVLDFLHVDHAELDRHSDLLRCETHAIRVIHRFEHVAGESPNSRVDFVDTPPFRPQSGMTILNDFQNHGWCHSTVPSMLQQAAISSAP